MRYYVVTYGDAGIEIEFFREDQKVEYVNAVCEAEKGHDRGEFDTWQDGEIA